MGQLVIEIPQRINRTYKIDDSDYGEELKEELDRRTDAPKIPGVIPPRRNDREESLQEVFGIWSDLEEFAQEIARQIREKNRKVT